VFAHLSLEGKAMLRFPLGVHLREEMEARGWFTYHLAHLTGLSLKDLGEILDDVRKPTSEEIEVLANAFGVSVELFENLSK
jgi:plasmid maintenance system antidote protein VapI